MMVITTFVKIGKSEKIMLAVQNETVGDECIAMMLKEEAPHKVDMRMTVKTQRMVKEVYEKVSKIDAVKLVRAFAECDLRAAKETADFLAGCEIGFWNHYEP